MEYFPSNLFWYLDVIRYLFSPTPPRKNDCLYLEIESILFIGECLHFPKEMKQMRYFGRKRYFNLIKVFRFS